MNFNFDDFFKIPVRASKINKCHPEVKRDKKWLLHFIPTFSIFTSVFLLMLYNISLNLKNNDFDQTCKNGVLSVVYCVVTFQLFVMIWKQDIILNLITSVKKDFDSAKSMSLNEQEILYEYVQKGMHVCTQWLIISCCASGIFILKNLILLLYQYIIGEPKFVPIYDLIYPKIIERNKENLIVYLATYALILFYGLYCTCMYTAFVPLGPIFMLHLCGQLEIVKKKIEDVFKGGDETQERLKEIILQLQCIYDFAEQILLAFRVNYELTLKATTIILPITCYEVLEALDNGEVSLEFIVFIIGGVLISSSPCYYSDLLMEKSEDVRIAVYSSGWESIYETDDYETARKISKTVKIIMMRALRPVAVRTLFRTVCLEALTDLFQQSYTIFNLMNAMWK